MAVHQPQPEEVPEELQVLLPSERKSPHSRTVLTAAFSVLVLTTGGAASWWVSGRGDSSEKGAGGLSLLQKYDWSSCAANGEDCLTSRCCREWGSTCFQKNDHWASCNKTCAGHMTWDQDTGGWVAESRTDVWECKALSATANGENCMHSKACQDLGSKCYSKNAHWASCNKTCSEQMVWGAQGWEEAGEKVWDCTVLSPTSNGENCMLSRACQDSQSQCFKKNDHWASCNKTCSEKMKWEDDKWVEKSEKVWDCKVLSPTANGENCMWSRDCMDSKSTCFKKNDHWASCNATCSEKMKWEDDKWVEKSETVWDCKVLLPGSKQEEEQGACDTSDCNGCSGEQCQYCMDEVQRDCCLEDKCTGCEGEQACLTCRAQHVDVCCEGRYPGCSGDAGVSNETSSNSSDGKEEMHCDVSECEAEAKQGNKTRCIDGKERECCLEEKCLGCSGESCTSCHKSNVEECCVGKGDECVTESGYQEPWEANCSTAACNGCGGEQCTYCMEEIHRDCCLAYQCQSCGNESTVCQSCRDENLAFCCRGMFPCNSTIMG